MRAVSGAVLGLLLTAAIAASSDSSIGSPAPKTEAATVDPEVKVLVDTAEQEHGLIVDHLTNSILGLAGHTSASMSAEERTQLALAAEPIFLQLEHAVRSHVQRLERARAKHSAKMTASSHAMVSAASDRAAGIFMGSSTSPTSCFACIYLMQRVLAETEPYYSPAVQAGTAAALSEAARHRGSGTRGVPVSHPLQSAYQTRNLPINAPNPENGSPLMQPGSGMNGWAPRTSPLLFHGGTSHPISNIYEQFPDREDSQGQDWDAEKVAKSMKIPALDKHLWPQLHEANEDEMSEEVEDEEEEEEEGDDEGEEEEEEEAVEGDDDEAEEDEEEGDDDGADEEEEEETDGGDEEEEEGDDGAEEEEEGGDDGADEEEEEEETDGGDEEEEEGADEEDEEEEEASLLQTQAASSSRSGASKEAAFLQSKARARAGAAASLTAAAESRAANVAQEDNAPPEAYMMYSDPPSIGPRIPPPVMQGDLPTDDTKPLNFNKHMGAPINFLGKDTDPAPPMVAPQGLIRALEQGIVPDMTPSGVGTLDNLGSGMGLTNSGPLMVAERDSSGKVVMDGNNLPKMKLVDLRSGMQNPYPRPHAELMGTASFLQQQSASRAEQDRLEAAAAAAAAADAASAPTDAASFLQTQTRQRSQAGAMPQEEFHVPNSFMVGEVPENAFFLRAHPPMVGPNVPPPLPNLPARTDRPVWGQQEQQAEMDGSRLEGTPGHSMEGFHNDLIPMTPDGGVAPMTGYPPINDVRSMDFPAGPVSGPAGPPPVGKIPHSFLQTQASDMPPVSRVDMLASASGSNSAIAGISSRDGKHNVGMPATPSKFDGDTLSQMINNPATVFDTDVRSPDLDFPPVGTDMVTTTSLPLSTDGKSVKVDVSLLQADGKSADAAKTGADGDGSEAKMEPLYLETEPGIPKDLAAGYHRGISKEGEPMTPAEISDRRKAFHASTTTSSGSFSNSFVQGTDMGGPEGITGPAYGCKPDTLDADGHAVMGKCPSGLHDRIADRINEQAVFQKYAPSHGRAHFNWPTVDGRPVGPTDGLAGGPTEQQKISKGLMGALGGLMGKFKKQSKVAVPSPSPIPVGWRGPSTGGGEVGSRFSDWNNPDAGLFDEPTCETDSLGKKPTILMPSEIEDPEDCAHRTWLGSQMTVKVGKKSKMYPKESYGKMPSDLKKLKKATSPKKGLFSLLQADAATGLTEHGAAASKASGRVNVHARRATAAAQQSHAAPASASAPAGAAPRMAETRAKAESKAAALRRAASAARAEANAKVAAASASEFNPAAAMGNYMERKRPVPHYCRSSDSGLCRQRLRAPSPWQLNRLFRRVTMESRKAALQAKWMRALERICTSIPAVGQSRPPLSEDLPGSSGAGKAKGLSGLFGKLGKSMSGLKNKFGLGGFSKSIKVNEAAPSGGIDGLLRATDQQQESGYEGARPPPRLQAEGLASNGKVESQPFTGYVTEPTAYGDHPAVGQMTDLGMPPLLAKQCSLLGGKLRDVADLYLHAYDMEETCVEIKMCASKDFGITHSAPGTSLKAKMYSTMFG